MTHDKQLQAVALVDVVEKRRLGQALNAKEFAVLVDISYSAAREWFRAPGFPVFRNHVFWEDFTEWRRCQVGVGEQWKESGASGPAERSVQGALSARDLPPKAARILLDR